MNRLESNNLNRQSADTQPLDTDKALTYTMKPQANAMKPSLPASSRSSWSTIRRSLKLVALTVAFGVLLWSNTAQAAPKNKDDGDDNDSEIVQSDARPYDLDIVGKVQAGGSDVGSTAFNNSILAEIRALANDDWSGLNALGNNAITLDPSKIDLATGHNVRAYFVGEQAGFRNSIGFNTQAGGVDSGDPTLLFPDATAPKNGYKVNQADGERSSKKPVLVGDFVDLGTIAAGTDLNFFLLAKGAQDPKATYSSERELNPSQNAYMKAFAYTSGDSSYLVMGFEDTLGNGNKDFTDVVIAFDIGSANIAALTATPEPGTMLTLGSLLGLVAHARRRRAAKSDPAACSGSAGDSGGRLPIRTAAFILPGK
jgi:hypothetical protein